MQLCLVWRHYLASALTENFISRFFPLELAEGQNVWLELPECQSILDMFCQHLWPKKLNLAVYCSHPKWNAAVYNDLSAWLNVRVHDFIIYRIFQEPNPCEQWGFDVYGLHNCDSLSCTNFLISLWFVDCSSMCTCLVCASGHTGRNVKTQFGL